ncbi:hypothetical protein QJS04_geneDACA003405 [Acorus gramineus]|uniref:adenylate dimethylallyltransferase (ADP/ATP-dependent) n=1 Tax=Acorus gramineus TaxID=55184 RepID=A0AAV9BR75_ACOGR|nr:hypothetical protein QJS04_geneDACA003405 [Acorus gramineus]
MGIPLTGCKQVPNLFTSDSFFDHPRRDKVIIVMGATGTGKSRLSIDLALRLNGEVINSDKIQVYKGLDIVTNKITPSDARGVPHHLLSVINPRADFTALDFCARATDALDSITARGALPIVAGGSNAYIEALVDGPGFRSRYECCFLWVDVHAPVLHEFVRERVDQMVVQGMVEEVRAAFDAGDADYSRGIRRAIGVPEMDRYLRACSRAGAGADASARALLEEAIEEVKANTCVLIHRQLRKIKRLRGLPGWGVSRVDATDAFHQRGSPGFGAAWEELVAAPAFEVVRRFLELDRGLDRRRANDLMVVPAAAVV